MERGRGRGVKGRGQREGSKGRGQGGGVKGERTEREGGGGRDREGEGGCGREREGEGTTGRRDRKKEQHEDHCTSARVVAVLPMALHTKRESAASLSVGAPVSVG